jgi:predicted nucleic acid-binding Zn ribbon protein
MQYDYTCECGNTQTFTAPIEIGPPEEMICEKCNEQMKRIFTTNFVLRGEHWPSKTLRQEKTGENPEAIEAHEKKTEEQRQEQENSNEVLAARRKGKKSFKEYKRKHPNKVEQYHKSLAKGVKGE